MILSARIVLTISITPLIPLFPLTLLSSPSLLSSTRALDRRDIHYITHARPSSSAKTLHQWKLMDLSSFLSVPPTHSSITDSPYLAGVDFDWFPDSLKLWSSEVSESYGGVSPSSQPLHPLTQRPTTIQYHPINPPLQNNEFSHRHRHRQRQPAVSSPSASFTGGDNVQKTIFFRAGDFQKNQRAESPVSCESSITIEGMSKACRYSPEEKKERIERYKTKRSQRNFNKKIKYACRKSLADSRPRVRGRFARYNEEVVKNHGVQWSHGRDEGDETNDGDNWIKYFIDAYSANLIP